MDWGSERRRCRSALGRDAFQCVLAKKHRGHGPLLQGGAVGSVGAPWGAMLFRPCPESIAGMARSYKGGVARSVEAPWGAMLSRPCSKSIAGMARSYRVVWWDL